MPKKASTVKARQLLSNLVKAVSKYVRENFPELVFTAIEPDQTTDFDRFLKSFTNEAALLARVLQGVGTHIFGRVVGYCMTWELERRICKIFLGTDAFVFEFKLRLQTCISELARCFTQKQGAQQEMQARVIVLDMLHLLHLLHDSNTLNNL